MKKHTSTFLTIAVLLVLSLGAWPARAASAPEEKIDFPLRGRTLTLALYRPVGPPKGTIVMGSGDVGWVGLAVDLSKILAPEGYEVVGINIRQYLSAFTAKGRHLTPSDIQSDYGALAQFLRPRGLLPGPVIVSGVSEGAAFAVVAAASAANHAWLDGVMTMGLPATAELAWRWTDFTSWITKKDAPEPSCEPAQYIAAVSPLPLWMIQSTKDEYVPKADYERFQALARPPSRLILIDAANHRFTDKRDELRAQVDAGLQWIAAERPKR